MKDEINYGTVMFESETYTLTDQAEPTSRLLPYPKNYHEVEMGEEYDYEMMATAVNDEGEGFYVYWILSDIKGEEREEFDWFDFSFADRVEPRD